MAQVRRYCIDCGDQLVYYPQLSTPKSPNEFRVLTYACPKCTISFETPKLIMVQRTQSDDPLKAVRLQIVRPAKKGKKI